MRVEVEELVNKNDIISNMMTYSRIVDILRNLQIVLEKEINGDIVELGCFAGTTSMYIRKLLDVYDSEKEFHVYDSWQGLPQLQEFDDPKLGKYKKGDFKVEKSYLVEIFKIRKLKLPVIHSGWFSEIPDEEFPVKICFAFFDGDLYSSITDSFNKVFYKVQSGGIIIIDDCGWDQLPGVEKACCDFLRGKNETLDLRAYTEGGGGRIIKL